MAKPERKIENYLMEQAEKNGFLCMKFISPGNSGVPDRILIGHGITFFVETKAPGEQTRLLQKSVIKDMRSHGAAVYVLDTEDKIDAVFEQLKIKMRLTETVKYDRQKNRQTATRSKLSIIPVCHQILERI